MKKNEDLFENYLEYLPPQKNAKILDLGCGTGRILEFLDQLNYSNLYGIDRHSPSLEIAKKNTPNAILTCSDDILTFLQKNENQFDCIIAKDVIYYFSKSTTLDHLTAIKKALKPGARLILEVYNGCAFTGSFIHDKDFYIQWTPNEHNISYLLSKTEFEIKKIAAPRVRIRTIKRLMHRMLQKIWHWHLHLIYFLERGVDPENPKILDKKIIVIAESNSKDKQ